MENQSPAQNAIRWGLIWGVVSIIIALLVYIVDITLFVKWWFGLLLLGISVAYVIYAGINYRQSVGNHIKFGKAWIHSFVTRRHVGVVAKALLVDKQTNKAANFLSCCTSFPPL